MKIIILHGEDIEKSYSRLKKFIDTARSRSWEVTYVDEAPGRISDQLSAISLFGSEQFFILKDIKKLTKTDLSWLDKRYLNLPGNLIIYHEGVLPVTFIKSLPKDVKIEEFKLPKIIWAFLDNMNIKDFHKVIEKEPPEFVFALIAKQFRDLYWVKQSSGSSSLPSWKVSKLRSQASRFDESVLAQIIEELAKIDTDVKTSKADLVSSLDLMFTKYIQ